MEPMLATQHTGRVLVVTLARPPVNALNDELIARLDAVVDRAAADADIAVLHLRSELTTFCAGADLALMHACLASPEGAEAMVELVGRMQRLFARLESTPVITLAEIEGAALGGGLELALACDLRVAAAEARLGLPEAGLGLLPAAGGTQRLTRLCGPGIAKRLILGAEVVTGDEAERLRIVQWVRPRAQLAEWTRDLAARLATLPTAAISAIKRCIAAEGDPARDGCAEEIAETRKLYDNPETRRRIAEFLARLAA
jgi:enoyl-CoA hydratase/carnithine racemase